RHRRRDPDRRVHPRRPAERLRDRRRAAVLAGRRRRRRADRRRVSRPASPEDDLPAMTTMGGDPMRRTLAAALALIGVLALAACGSSKKSNTSTASSGGSSTSSSSSGGKHYKMTLVAGVKGDEFYITMNCGAQAEAKKLGVSLNFQGPDQFDPSLQTPVVNAVAAKKPDAVLVAPTDSKAMFAPINALKTNGSKVVLVDTTLDDASIAESQIASDNLG